MGRLLVLVWAALCLAACGGGGGGPGATATVALAPVTSPLATELPAATAAAPSLDSTATALPATQPAGPTTPAPAEGAAATLEAGAATVGGDPLLRTYRTLVAIQMNAALVSEAAAQVQAGRVDQAEMPVAALALGALTQAVDEAVPTVAPPPALAAQWDAAVARHEEVKSLGARWLIGQVSVAEVAAAMTPIQADLERLVSEADAVVAAEYGVSPAELTEHRVRLVAAVGEVFE